MALSRGPVRTRLKVAYRRLPPRARRPIATLYTQAERQRTRWRERRALLSVVMPVYNVEAYLEEAVRSVLTQEHRNFELILVDDGSTDTSGTMCDDFAREDERVRVIHKRNAGLGAARNTGIAAARGPYLVFIDSDDFVPAQAYAHMVASLERTGSDLATGNVQRKQGTRTYQAWNQSRSHLHDRQRVTLTQLPELLYDTVAWNKVYRREFFLAHVRGFPEGKLYEDMLPVFTALASATSIDILSEVVYVWRLRDEGTSITQRLLEPQNIDDRFEMLDGIDSTMTERNLPEEMRDLLRDKVLEGDLWIYLREMRGAPPEVIERIRRGVLRYWSTASDARKAGAHPEHRVCYWLYEQNRADEVEAFREWYRTIHAAPPLADVPGQVVLDPSDCPVSLAGIPQALLDLEHVAHIVANAMSLAWTQPTVLSVSGYAYTRFVSDGTQQIQLLATDERAGRTEVFDVRRTESPESALWAWDTAGEHEHDGYVCDIDVERLREASPLSGGRSEWSFRVRVTDRDVVRDLELTRIWRSGAAGVVPASLLADGTVAIVRTNDPMPLRVAFDRTGIVADAVDGDGSTIRVALAAQRSQIVWAVEARTRREVPGRREEGSDQLVFELPAPTGGALSSWWTFHADRAGHRVAVLAPAGFTEPVSAGSTGLRPSVNRSGQLTARYELRTAVVDDVRLADNGDLELTGAVSALGAFELSLTADPAVWHRAEVTGDRFTARVPLTRPASGGRVLPYPEDKYEIQARLVDGPEGRVIVTNRLVGTFPASYERDVLNVRLSRTGRSGLAVDLTPPIPASDRSRINQLRLMDRYVVGETRELENAVLFYTDLGSTVGDSALAIARELARRDSGLRLYWGVTDLSVPVPDDVTAVVKLSSAWYEKINTCRYLVNNYGGLWGLRKGADQRYLQTWHGTPYKYIGASEQRHKRAATSAITTIANEAAEWDAVVSPSPYMTEIIASELLYTGPVLETGYPRNDQLSTASPDEVAAIRDSLGLPRGAKALLYAPTYRENQRQGWKAALFDALDADRLLDLLGPEWYIVLRGHSFNARNDSTDRSHGRLIDATRHPGINDLYLAADALVTDYSSVMFDFAVTGKPMAFFAPDLTQYEAARGVYLDLAATVPGPVVSDVVHLADALRDLDALRAEQATAYAAFRARFVPWDDGKATARVVDAFFS